MTEKVLPFDRKIIRQDTGYWCGPASAQMALSSRGKFVDEATLARECRTTQNGTDNVGLIERVLDVRIPDAKYLSVYPGGLKIGTPARPANERRDYFWWDVVRSIDAGYPVILNWVVPPNRKPIRGVKGSPNPSYGGGTTYHYVTCVGWSDEGNDGRPSLLIADSGFAPNVYWVDFETAFQLIHTDGYKGYAFADHPLNPPPAGVRVPPGVPIAGTAPAPAPAPAPPPAIVKPAGKIADPGVYLLTKANRYENRDGKPWPFWIALHTSESRSRARDLRQYCETHEVSYHGIGDDREVIRMVRDEDGSWSAVGANNLAYHYCFSSSFAGWSREAWLDPNPADGYNEREALRLGAKQVAFWIQLSIERGRPIPLEWIKGRGTPPWGHNGICDHSSFGAWGGGHSDVGHNFPVNTFMDDVRFWLTGTEAPPIAAAPPVVLPGTNPDRYADWLEYAGKPNPNRDRVAAIQAAMNRPPTPFGLDVDGIFGPLTRLAVIGFQQHVHLVADGIVGPMTAAALNP
ncbi:endolysin [Mycobacterium phage MOOREtheMARYer]|uniref:Lysin A n=1 Tax=Mycobacterium phage MOOREtheMARYer TaxID=1647309 RepID=A0A0F6YQN9_9CAUD|nr:endolysin [Mycobacterium phage MOOREtheMARYer]AKF14889.1 lysin A [Mycobacterium phage MOOREtheMARYer]